MPVAVSLSLSATEPKRARLDGAVLRSAEQLRSELATLVFTPDRLVVVKGGPAARRAYLDRSLGRLYPGPRPRSRSTTRRPSGQRNAALRRVAARASRPRRARAVDGAGRRSRGDADRGPARRRSSCSQPGFAERAGELGLADASLGYDAEPPTITALEERLDRDIERGTTGAGPHLDEIAIRAGDRDLRTFGSQGEQRLAVLALLLAEAELIATRRRVPPLLLLDDALSELDESRRRDPERENRRGGADDRHGDRAGGAPARAGAAPRGHARPAWTVGLMERLEDVRARRAAGRRRAGRRRAGRGDPRAGRTLVGDAIARAAWPQRIARDGTLLVAATSSTWAFELGLLADEILAKLAAAVGRRTPRRRSASAPGAVPAPPAPRLPTRIRRQRSEIDADDAAASPTQLTAAMTRRRAARDDRARRRGEPRAGPLPTAVSDTLLVSTKSPICRAFLLRKVI